MAYERIFSVAFFAFFLTSSCMNPCNWLSRCFAQRERRVEYEIMQDKPLNRVIIQPAPAKSSLIVSSSSVIPPRLISQIQALKKIFRQNEVFKNDALQTHILDYLGDESYIHAITLCEQAYILKGTYSNCVGWKGFFLPIMRMQFCNQDSELRVFMAKKLHDESNHILTWDLNSQKLIGQPCKAYFDVELECARPPAKIEALSANKQFKAVVTHEFYPNDDEYPAPGRGAYKPQYHAKVDIVWNYTYKQFLAYVFLGIGK